MLTNHSHHNKAMTCYRHPSRACTGKVLPMHLFSLYQVRHGHKHRGSPLQFSSSRTSRNLPQVRGLPELYRPARVSHCSQWQHPSQHTHPSNMDRLGQASTLSRLRQQVTQASKSLAVRKPLYGLCLFLSWSWHWRALHWRYL